MSGSRWALGILVMIAVLVAGCAGVANPQGWAGPQLADDTLYASIDKGKLAALDPNDLSVQWVFPPDTEEGDKLDLEAIYGAPVVDQGFVYFGAYDGNVYGLDAQDGTLRWAFPTDDPVIGSLALKDGMLYAGSADGYLYAIDAGSGAEVERFDTGSNIWASPLIVEDTVYVAAMNGRAYALDAETLEERPGFSFETNGGLVMDPTLANDDTLLVGGIDSKLYALDPASGEEKWSFEGGNWFWARPLIDGDRVYAADLDGNVYALSLDDRSSLWSSPFKAEAPVRSAPVLAGETLVIVDRDGNVYGRNPDDGTAVSGWPTNPDTDEPSVALDKTVLSDPFLFDGANSPTGSDSPPTNTPAGESPTPTEEASPTARPEDASGAELIIVAQGGDICRINPADGSPAAPLLCEEVPL